MSYTKAQRRAYFALPVVIPTNASSVRTKDDNGEFNITVRTLQGLFDKAVAWWEESGGDAQIWRRASGGRAPDRLDPFEVKACVKCGFPRRVKVRVWHKPGTAEEQRSWRQECKACDYERAAQVHDAGARQARAQAAKERERQRKSLQKGECHGEDHGSGPQGNR